MEGQTALAALALAWAEGRTGGSCAGVQGLPVLWRERALSPRDGRAGWERDSVPGPAFRGVCSRTEDRGPRTLSFSQNTNESWPSPPCSSNGKKESALA